MAGRTNTSAIDESSSEYMNTKKINPESLGDYSRTFNRLFKKYRKQTSNPKNTTENLLNALNEGNIRHSVIKNGKFRKILIDKNDIGRNDSIMSAYDARKTTENDSIELNNAYNQFRESGLILNNKYPKSYNTKDRGTEGKYVDNANGVFTKQAEKALYRDKRFVEDFLSDKKTINNTANHILYANKYKKLINDLGKTNGRIDGKSPINYTTGKRFRYNAKYDMGNGLEYKSQPYINYPYATKEKDSFKPNDSFELVDFGDKTQNNIDKLNDQALESSKRQESSVRDMRNEVAAQKTFSKPKEEESKAPKFTSIGRSSMGNMLELYNEKGNMVESMSPTAKNVRKVMKHLGVGDENSSDDDVKTWFKDFSKQTDKGKRITFNTTSKKK